MVISSVTSSSTVSLEGHALNKEYNKPYHSTVCQLIAPCSVRINTVHQLLRELGYVVCLAEGITGIELHSYMYTLLS